MGRTALTVAALGVVFGDIGTSPIYTVQTAFNPSDPHPIHTSLTSVYGFVSLVFWAVMVEVTFKYVGLVMGADNDGEGGIMALISLIRQIPAGVQGRIKFLLAGLGVFGAALFFGDSMITPAISVLSAVEGTQTISSSMSNWVIPITLVIIVASLRYSAEAPAWSAGCSGRSCSSGSRRSPCWGFTESRCTPRS